MYKNYIFPEQNTSYYITVKIDCGAYLYCKNNNFNTENKMCTYHSKYEITLSPEWLNPNNVFKRT